MLLQVWSYQYYICSLTHEYYTIATLLDPRLKQRVFSSSSLAVLAKQMFIAEHKINGNNY